MEILNEAPRMGAFVPVAEHQSTTPVSFHTGPPVLHYYSDRCKVVVLEDELQYAPALSNLVSKTCRPVQVDTSSDTVAGDSNGVDHEQKTLEDIDVWVTSDKLLLYSTTSHVGLTIDYRSISIHATQSFPTPSSDEPSSQSLYMQLIPSLTIDPSSDEPPDTVSLTIIPTAAAAPSSIIAPANEDDALATEDQPKLTPVEALYKALSDCSDLHPDPVDDEDDGGVEGMSRLMQAGLAIPGMSDGSMPPAMPGSGGWITAENMNEFVDDDGNWIEDDENEQMDEELGPGAGTVRSRPDTDDAEVDGRMNVEGEDAKWQRTS